MAAGQISPQMCGVIFVWFACIQRHFITQIPIIETCRWQLNTQIFCRKMLRAGTLSATPPQGSDQLGGLSAFPVALSSSPHLPTFSYTGPSLMCHLPACPLCLGLQPLLYSVGSGLVPAIEGQGGREGFLVRVPEAGSRLGTRTCKTAPTHLTFPALPLA